MKGRGEAEPLHSRHVAQVDYGDNSEAEPPQLLTQGDYVPVQSAAGAASPGPCGETLADSPGVQLFPERHQGSSTAHVPLVDPAAAAAREAMLAADARKLRAKICMRERQQREYLESLQLELGSAEERAQLLRARPKVQARISGDSRSARLPGETRSASSLTLQTPESPEQMPSLPLSGTRRRDPDIPLWEVWSEDEEMPVAPAQAAAPSGAAAASPSGAQSCAAPPGPAEGTATPMLRRNGLPGGAIVQREGDLFETSPARLEYRIAWVLTARMQKLRQLGLAEDAFLPSQAQAEVRAELRAQFEAGEGRRKVEEVSGRGGAGRTVAGSMSLGVPGTVAGPRFPGGGGGGGSGAGGGPGGGWGGGD